MLEARRVEEVDYKNIGGRLLKPEEAREARATAARQRKEWAVRAVYPAVSDERNRRAQAFLFTVRPYQLGRDSKKGELAR